MLQFFGVQRKSSKKKRKPSPEPQACVSTDVSPQSQKESIATQPQNSQVIDYLASQRAYLDYLPWFLKPKYVQDSNGNRPAAGSLYNPNTLHLPADDLQKMTSVMQQYWRIKSAHFSKVVFFQLGKFYELFYADAILGHQLFDLQWMGKVDNLHVGFMHCSRDKYAQLFVEQGHQVVVVDQMDGKTDGLCKREITQVITRAMFVQYEWVLFVGKGAPVIEGQQTASICLFTLQGLQLKVGQVDEPELRTLVAKMRPCELLYDRFQTPMHFQTCIKQLRGVQRHCLHPTVSTSQAQSYFPQQEFTKDGLFVLSMLVTHLKATLQTSTIEHLEVSEYENQGQKAQFMKLDAPCLQQLDIVDTEGTPGSFFHYLNHTVSLFGKRMLLQWVTAPLIDPLQISSRRQAVLDLSRHPETVTLFFAELEKLPDLERLISQAFCEVQMRLLPVNRLKEFYQLISYIKSLKQALAVFTHVSDEFLSQRLRGLVTYERLGGLMPDLDQAIGEFEALINWIQVSQTEHMPQPVKGFDKAYDRAQDELSRVTSLLDTYLAEIKTLFPQNRRYQVRLTQHVHPIEVEVPDSVVFERPQDFELSSKRANFFRFTSV